MRVIIASASPRRQELLRLVVHEYEVCVSGAEEMIREAQPERMVEDLALQKAQAVASRNSDALVIGADTLVFVDGKPLGKPADREDARRMIKMLAGREHSVCTGVALVYGDRSLVGHEKTVVEFLPLSEEEISDYLDEEDYKDKAGAYGIQGAAAKLIRRIEGCFFNVVGLPVSKVYCMLKEFGR